MAGGNESTGCPGTRRATGETSGGGEIPVARDRSGAALAATASARCPARPCPAPRCRIALQDQQVRAPRRLPHPLETALGERSGHRAPPLAVEADEPPHRQLGHVAQGPIEEAAVPIPRRRQENDARRRRHGDDVEPRVGARLAVVRVARAPPAARASPGPIAAEDTGEPDPRGPAGRQAHPPGRDGALPADATSTRRLSASRRRRARGLSSSSTIESPAVTRAGPDSEVSARSRSSDPREQPHRGAAEQLRRQVARVLDLAVA